MTPDLVDGRLPNESALHSSPGALDQTLFLEASAGTGKTKALVDQVVALVLAGAEIERIVAITFTEKAAAELRDRIRGELERQKKQAAGSEGYEHIQRALDSLDRAQISTIHSFGLSILRTFAAEAGIDPSFVVQDEVLAERRQQERWRSYLGELAENPAALVVVDRALSLGLTTRDLETLAHDLAGRPGLAHRLAANPLSAPAVNWPSLEDLQRRIYALPLELAPSEDQLRLRVEKLGALVDRLIRAGEERESVLATGAAVLCLKWGISSALVWGAVIRDVRDTATEVQSALKKTLACVRASALADLLPFVVRFVCEEAVRRGRDGTLVFDDLILTSRDLLQEQPGAAETLRDRYRVLLIDEFQDTDPLQVEIALAFATDPQTRSLEPGRLFLVGDPKQSIYRFRRADMAMYSQTIDLVRQHGGVVEELRRNRRSRQVIVDWVNTVFARLIGDGATPTVQPPYQPIQACRSEMLRGPGVACLGGEQENSAATEVRRKEASAIAAQCRAVLDEEWHVGAQDGSSRPASLRDIAILIPRRLLLNPLERALARAHIPYRVEGGSLLYQTQEVRDLINCLTAIDDPADEVAIVGALRSPAFACADVELARHRAAGGGFNYLRKDLNGREGPVPDALRTLAAYHAARHERSIATLVERFVADRGQDEVGILADGNRDAFRRVRYVIEQARAFEAQGPESLRAFVSWLEHRAGEAVLDHEGAGLDEDEDSVRILTVHGAKGLEFPIVLIAGLSAEPGNQPGTFMVDRAQERVAVSIGAKSRNSCFMLGDVESLQGLERQHASAELNRLLYVAATRARDHLIVSLYHSQGRRECMANRAIQAGAREAATQLPEPGPVPYSLATPLTGLHVEIGGTLESAPFVAAREDLVRASRHQRYTSATGLAAKEEPTDESEPWARGRGGTRLGRAVHATIQSLSLEPNDPRIEAFSRAQAVAEAIPDRDHEVARLVGRALASAAAKRARSALRALREVPFAVALDGQVVEGFIDMVIDAPDGLEVVDWKTDQIPAEAVPRRLNEYELQAGLYVLGLQSATGRPVSQVTYAFVSAGVEESPGEPAALAAAARAHLAAAATV